MRHVAVDPADATDITRWWERPDLRYQAGDLRFVGQSVREVTEWARKPVFLYSPARALGNLRRVDEALRSVGRPHRIFYALKANRFAPLVTLLAQSGLCGVDVCAPREIEAALSAGFPADRISYTGTSLSDADLDALVRHPDMLVNCDSLSMLRRIGERAPGRAIGIRVNPAIGVGGNDRLEYAGTIATKFGIHREQWRDALRLVDQHGLKLTSLHFHAGCGYSDRHLPRWAGALDRVLDLAASCSDVRLINIGGGLGVPHYVDAERLDLLGWSALLRGRFAKTRYTVAVEPGDYIVKDAGILVLTVNGVETKGTTRFVSVDGGFNLHPEPVFYDLPCEPVPCRLRQDSAPAPVTIAGNINEALDIWYRDFLLAPVLEGDRIAFLNAGGYGSAMSSNHCLRGDFHEQILLS